MTESLKNQYKYKKVKLNDGEYLDIEIALPLPETPITKNKETDYKYLKCFLTEGVNMSKSVEHKKDVDFRVSSIINFHNLSKLLYPTFIYSLVIIYKRFTRGKINSQNTRKVNLIPRLKGLGAAFALLVSANFIFKFFNKTLIEGRLDFLQELINDDDEKKDLNLEDYEKFKSLYSDEINKNQNEGFKV